MTADGYNDAHEDFYIHAYDSLYHDFYLDDAPQSRFFGHVTNADGDSLSDVRIYFQDQNGNWSNTEGFINTNEVTVKLAKSLKQYIICQMNNLK